MVQTFCVTCLGVYAASLGAYARHLGVYAVCLGVYAAIFRSLCYLWHFYKYVTLQVLFNKIMSLWSENHGQLTDLVL